MSLWISVMRWFYRTASPPEVAAALPVALNTEQGALTKAGFTPGQTVLITGASTGVGLIGAQLAKARGAAHVFGTTRDPSICALLAAAGVDTVIVTSVDDMAEIIDRETGGDGVNIVLDHVAGQTFADVLPLTHVDGKVAQIGRLAGARSTIGIDALSYRNLTVHGVSFCFSRPAELDQNMRELEPDVLAAVTRGEIRPVIDQTMPWTHHEKAAARLLSGEPRGKIVLTIATA